VELRSSTLRYAQGRCVWLPQTPYSWTKGVAGGKTEFTIGTIAPQREEIQLLLANLGESVRGLAAGIGVGVDGDGLGPVLAGEVGLA
jgi:hypothetical protein